MVCLGSVSVGLLRHSLFTLGVLVMMDAWSLFTIVLD